MKATLEFNLDEPEDRDSHLRCIMADKITFLLFEIKQKIRNYNKYESTTPDKVLEEITELINESGLNEIIE